jgi:hypothetical protein
MTDAAVTQADIDFLAAARRLAVASLQQQSNPRFAVQTWLGKASGREFRDGPLRVWLTAIYKDLKAASEALIAEAEKLRSASAGGQARRDTRVPLAPALAEPDPAGERGQRLRDTHDPRASTPAGTDPASARGHSPTDTHAGGAPAPAGPDPAGERGHSSADTHDADVSTPAGTDPAGAAGHEVHDTQGHVAPAPAGTEPEGGGQSRRETHAPLAAPGRGHTPGHLGISWPTTTQQTAVDNIKLHVLSGVYITGHDGNEKIPVEQLTVGGLQYRLEVLGKRVARAGVEYNTLYLINAHIDRQAHVPKTHTVGGVLDVNTIRHYYEMAKAFAGSPMVQLPQAMRLTIDAA